MFFCTGSFVAHSARLRGFVERFRLARGCATARERGFILPTEASSVSVTPPFDCWEKMFVID
jgi:hypothetical protein